jgi:hypothetical protein
VRPPTTSSSISNAEALTRRVQAVGGGRIRPQDEAALARLRVFTQAYRPALLALEGASEWRKTARIIAVQLDVPFTVETDRGVMVGRAGDWLVTNHPDDDPGSDLWTISAERMAATYSRVGVRLGE